jgi:hypothetical protein
MPDEETRWKEFIQSVEDEGVGREAREKARWDEFAQAEADECDCSEGYGPTCDACLDEYCDEVPAKVQVALVVIQANCSNYLTGAAESVIEVYLKGTQTC